MNNFQIKKTPGIPNPIDIHVGERVRLRRTLLGISQEKLGKAIGLTFQQIQKYERGQNRIGASRLWSISKVLNVPVDFFFEDMEACTAVNNTHISGFSTGDSPKEVTDPMNRKKTLQLVRAFYRISDPKVANSLFDLIITMAESPR
ncbi:MAG: helix-turn-helix transcriptional regulator [Alphaproteobacteria bacterium]|nr:helix-turn-helix transcriptional regulator [Alphaproteobacteria bacterium]